MLARRLGIGLAVLVLALVVIVSVVARVEDGDRARAPQPTPAGVPAKVVDGELPNDGTVRAAVGDVVELTVHSDEDDTAVIDALGEETDTAPTVPGVLEFVAWKAGTFPVVLDLSGETVGELVIEPASS